MAYSAVISLKQTIQYLLNSPQISVVSSSREILNYAHTHLTSFQEVLRLSDDSNCNRNRLNLLEEQITQILHQLEDVLEFRAADTFLSGSSLPLKLDKELITTKIEAVKKMEKEYVKESETPVFEEEDLSANAIPSRNAPLKMIGLSDTFTDLKDHLTRIIRPDDFGFFSFVGLPGTGRSILAKRVYDDVYADGKGQSFDCGAWVKIGSTYTLKQILLSIISEISKGHQSSSSSEEEDKLSEHRSRTTEASSSSRPASWKWPNSTTNFSVLNYRLSWMNISLGDIFCRYFSERILTQSLKSWRKLRRRLATTVDGFLLFLPELFSYYKKSRRRLSRGAS